MYADTSILLPYFQSFSHEAHHLEEFCRNQRTCSSMGSELYALNHGCSGEVILHSYPIPLDHMLGPIVMGNFGQTSTLSDYDLGGEGDLFKAPEPIIEEPEMGLDPMTAISVVSCGEDAMSPQTMKLADLESFQSEQLLNEVFYECEKDLLAKSAIEEPFSDISDVKIPVACMDVDPIVAKDGLLPEGPIQKSISSGCLSSMEWLHGAATRPNFLDFQLVDFGDDYGMRRAFSEGDMQTLRSGNTSLTYSPFERPLTIGCYNIEERKQKLSRYRKKRTKRNFGRKIKYACRKALADSQPRVRGRFAKSEELEVSKK